MAEMAAATQIPVIASGGLKVAKVMTSSLDKSVALPRPIGFLLIILAVYAVSFALPVDLLPAHQASPGWGYFYLGIIGMKEHFASTFPWFANPLLWFGLWRLWKRDYWGAAILGLIATVLAACWIPIGRLRENTASALGPGYWTWLTSFALLAGTSLTRLIRGRGKCSDVLDQQSRSSGDIETAFRADERPPS